MKISRFITIDSRLALSIASFPLRWVYTFDAVKRFDTLLYASQMRIKAFAAYLFILFTPASTRDNAREKA